MHCVDLYIVSAYRWVFHVRVNMQQFQCGVVLLGHSILPSSLSITILDSSWIIRSMHAACLPNARRMTVATPWDDDEMWIRKSIVLGDTEAFLSVVSFSVRWLKHPHRHAISSLTASVDDDNNRSCSSCVAPIVATAVSCHRRMWIVRIYTQIVCVACDNCSIAAIERFNEISSIGYTQIDEKRNCMCAGRT